MKKEKLKLSLLKEVVQELTTMEQFSIKGGLMKQVPTGKRGTVRTK